MHVCAPMYFLFHHFQYVITLLFLLLLLLLSHTSTLRGRELLNMGIACWASLASFLICLLQNGCNFNSMSTIFYLTNFTCEVSEGLTTMLNVITSSKCDLVVWCSLKLFQNSWVSKSTRRFPTM